MRTEDKNDKEENAETFEEPAGGDLHRNIDANAATNEKRTSVRDASDGNRPQYLAKPFSVEMFLELLNMAKI